VTNRLLNEACNCSEEYFELHLLLHNTYTECSLHKHPD
jgi:hypothetical protein